VIRAWAAVWAAVGGAAMVWAAGAAAESAPAADLREDPQMYGRLEKVGQTWVEIGGTVYGAKPDGRGPIGGGPGYTKLVTAGQFKVTTLDGLIDALAKAKAGDVVYIDGSAEIDCTARVHVDGLVLEIPAGVTLAGDRGHKGSRGALLFSDALKTRPLIRVAGPNVRITGLRLRGPDPRRRMDHHRRSFQQGRGRKYYYRFPVSDGIRTDHAGLEVDNCEIAGFSHAGVYLVAGEEHRIHHNYIHHCQYNGLGYGVCHDRAFSKIEYNLFNWNRHSIAGTGRPPSGYEAAHNVEIRHSLSHLFDMHGGADRKDGTNIAGTRISIHHNTFRPAIRAIKIRGLPQESADVHHNWFGAPAPGPRTVSSPGRTRVHDNAYGRANPRLADKPAPPKPPGPPKK